MSRVHFVGRNLDLIYIIIVACAIIADFIFSNAVLEATIYVLILFGFGLSLIPWKKDNKDERKMFIKHIAGYSAFLLSALSIVIFSLLNEYIEVQFDVANLLRTVGMMMFFVFIAINAVGKRLI
jgi:glucose uptake protein GlcU